MAGKAVSRLFAIRATLVCALVALTLTQGCNQKHVLHTAKLSVTVDGREIVDQNDLAKIEEILLHDGILWPAESSTMYTQFSFSDFAANRLYDETNAHIGKQLEVVIDGMLLYSKPIKKATSTVKLEYNQGSKEEWMNYFFGQGDVDVSRSIRDADDL